MAGVVQTLSSVGFATKIKILLGLWIMVFVPIKMELMSLAVLVLIDTITGITVSLKYNYFNSKRITSAVVKVLLYACMITTSLAVENILGKYYETQMLTMFVIGVLAVTELFSVLENLSALGLPIPNIFGSIMKDLDYKGFGSVMELSTARRRISRNMEILLNKYLMLIDSKDAIQLLTIKFKLWNKHVIEPLANTPIKSYDSFINSYNLMILDAKEQTRLVVKQHKNLSDEFERFGSFSYEKIEELKYKTKMVVEDPNIRQDIKNLKVAELHVDLMYNLFNEVLILENYKTSLPEYQKLN